MTEETATALKRHMQAIDEIVQSAKGLSVREIEAACQTYLDRLDSDESFNNTVWCYVHSKLCHLHFMQWDLNAAKERVHQALDLLDGVADIALNRQVLTQAGTIHSMLGDTTKAVALHMKSSRYLVCYSECTS